MPTADVRDMQALCSDDEQAFRRLIRRHQQELMAYCFRVTSDHALAQDIAQEVFLTLWKQRKRYREQGKLKHYLIKIARLRCLASLKKRRADTRLRTKAAEMNPGSSTGSSYADDAAVQAALERIKSEHRDLLVLRHFEGLALAEIQSITGLRLGTIKSRLHRAMAALREELDDGR